MHYVDFAPSHLSGIMALTAAEGWQSLADDAERTHRALTAPGVHVVVALDGNRVGGYARALSDGMITTYLAELIVGLTYRGQGVGRRLIEEIFRRTGAGRMDLLSEEAAEGFYRTFGYRTKPGYRSYRPEPGASR